MNTRQREFEKLLIEINAYIANLYQEDVAKFRARVLSFQRLQNLLGQVANPKAIPKTTVKEVLNFCSDEATKFKGKGGRQAYSNLLFRMEELCAVPIKDFGSATKDLANGIKNNRDESSKILVGFTAIKSRAIKDYIGKVEKEITQAEKGGIFTKKINLSLSKAKKQIAEDLQFALVRYGEKPKPKRLIELQKAIVKADLDHQYALKEEYFGKPKRLGKLITELKQAMTNYAPIEFDNALRDGAKNYQTKNSQRLY